MHLLLDQTSLCCPLNLPQPAGASRPCVFLLHDYMGGAHFTTPSLWQRCLRAAQVSLAITSPYKPPSSYPPSPAWEDRDPLWLGGELRSPPSLALLSPTLGSPWSCAEPFAAGLSVYLLGCGEIPGKPGLPPNQILGAMNDVPLGSAPVLSVRFKRAQTSALNDSMTWTCFLSWSPALIYFSFKM